MVATAWVSAASTWSACSAVTPCLRASWRMSLRARATVGEVCNALREVWGTYVPSDAF